MSRKDQICRIDELDLELSTRLALLSVSARRPLATIKHHQHWLLPGAGFLFGVAMAKLPFRRIVSRGISATFLLMRVSRMAARTIQKMG